VALDWEDIAMLILPLAWFFGGLLGITIESVLVLPVPAISFLLFGGLVAADKNLSKGWFSMVIIGVGLFMEF
jgi:hypothetical protein